MKNKIIYILTDIIINSKIIRSIHIYLNKYELILKIPLIKFFNKKLDNIFDKESLLKYGYIYNIKKNISLKSSNNAVLYIVQNSLPETNNGYAIRTHDIARALQVAYTDVYPLTRVGYPYDILNMNNTSNTNEIEVDNVKYHRLYKKGFHLHEVTLSKYISNYTLMITEFALKKKVFLLHAASNYVNGLSAINASQILNIPSIYEVRGFWEITRASREKGFKNTTSFRMQKKLEIQACQDATSVIALSELVKEELINRGVDEKKIYIIPNTVDTKKFSFKTRNLQLLSSLNWHDKFVVGFIGSVVDYEGLILLIQAAEIIIKSNDKIRFLIVGDGNHLEYLKKEVKKKSLSDIFHFTGRVPYSQVLDYYSILDVACYPRRDWEVCAIVSPKKPFEAMSYGIPIIVSSVKANSYFIQDTVTGLIHKKESVSSLVDAIHTLYSDDNLRSTLSKNSRQWVIENRDISKVPKLLESIYSQTISQYKKNTNV